MRAGTTEREQVVSMSAGGRGYRVEYLIVDPVRPADAVRAEQARLGAAERRLRRPGGGRFSVTAQPRTSAPPARSVSLR